MSNAGSKLQELIKATKVLEQKDIPNPIKKKSLIEVGIKDSDAISFLLKLKKGALNTITLYLDESENSECAINFRLLTAQEWADVELEMHNFAKERDLSYTSVVYSIYYTSKILSRASRNMPYALEKFSKSNQPELSEEELRLAIDPDTLLSLGNKYLEFKNNYAPQMETITDDDINEFVEELNRCEDDLIKKLVCLNGLKSRQTEKAVLLDIHRRYQDLQKQLESLLTG